MLVHLNLLDVNFAVQVSTKYFWLFLFNSVLASAEMRQRRRSGFQRFIANVACTVGSSLPTLKVWLLVFRR